MNTNSTLLSNLLKELHFLIRKTSWDLFTENKEFLPEFLPEDYSQELSMELCRQFGKIQELNEKMKLGTIKEEDKHRVVVMDSDNLIPVFIELIRREKLHWLSSRPYTAKRNRDQHLVRETNAQGDSSSSEDSPEYDDSIFSGAELLTSDEILQDLDEQVINTYVFRELSKYEERYPGVTRFLNEALNPSEVVWNKFEEYKQSMRESGRVLRNMGNATIPPTVLLELLGESRNRLYSFKKVISYVYSDVGFPVKEINERWKSAEYCFETRTL